MVSNYITHMSLVRLLKRLARSNDFRLSILDLNEEKRRLRFRLNGDEYFYRPLISLLSIYSYLRRMFRKDLQIDLIVTVLK